MHPLMLLMTPIMAGWWLDFWLPPAPTKEARPMASVTLHPNATEHPLERCRVAAADWAFDMLARGYELNVNYLSNNIQTLTAVPQDAHTNANVARFPRHRRQYGGGALPAGPDDDGPLPPAA